MLINITSRAIEIRSTLSRFPFKEYSCAMVDSCPSYGSEDETFEMLMHNFKRHFNSNRAPLGLYFHTSWFKKRLNLRAFQVTPSCYRCNSYTSARCFSFFIFLFGVSQRFLEEMVKMPEVWVVNNWEAIQWMQKPTPLNLLNQFEPWKCKTQVSQ